jgi:hypothetical protein
MALIRLLARALHFFTFANHEGRAFQANTALTLLLSARTFPKNRIALLQRPANRPVIEILLDPIRRVSAGK